MSTNGTKATLLFVESSPKLLLITFAKAQTILSDAAFPVSFVHALSSVSRNSSTWCIPCISLCLLSFSIGIPVINEMWKLTFYICLIQPVGILALVSCIDGKNLEPMHLYIDFRTAG
eukprot:m.168971 g.168971  ORF g.168971 m.168971 type:complete len:117 (+) comp15324_c0_seq4:589-939(+)